MQRLGSAGAVAWMLVAVLAVAGCGSGGDDRGKNVAQTTATGPLTKKQFIAAADRLCRATSKKIATAATNLRESARTTKTIPVQDVSRFLTQTSLPAYDDLLDDLRELRPPAGDEQEIDRLIASIAGAIDTAKADPVKYSKNGSPDPFDDANSRAMTYGMKDCGS